MSLKIQGEGFSKNPCQNVRGLKNLIEEREFYDTCENTYANLNNCFEKHFKYL